MTIKIYYNGITIKRNYYNSLLIPLLYKIECFIDVTASNKIDYLTCVIIHDNLAMGRLS